MSTKSGSSTAVADHHQRRLRDAPSEPPSDAAGSLQIDQAESESLLPGRSKGSKDHGSSSQLLQAVVYGLGNLASVVTIVVANKVVMTNFKFSFPVCLTFFHSIVTSLGMVGLAAAGMFEVRQLPWAKAAPVACAYVSFIVFNNLSIQVNTVGFYQISKIMITPVVVLVEYFAYGKTVSRQKLCAIALLMVGIAVATVTDAQVKSNLLGIFVACGAVISSSLYQVWAGSKQKELGVNGNQLLHQVSPIAVLLLEVLIPVIEPVGWSSRAPGTILGYSFSTAAVLWILFSSCLGLAVTATTFLFIGVTSPLTYNVVGHLKTVFIVTSGVLLFKDTLNAKKLVGVVAAMAGIVWYTSSGVTGQQQQQQQPQAAAAAAGKPQQQQQQV